MKRHWWYAAAAAALVVVVTVILVVVSNQVPSVPTAPALATPQNLQAVVNGPATAVVGQPVEFVGQAAGSSAKPHVGAFCFGDSPCAKESTPCGDTKLEAPKPARIEERRKHTYTKAGRYTVTFEVDGGCTGYSGKASAVRTITVAARR